jgi:hypothetical protein
VWTERSLDSDNNHRANLTCHLHSRRIQDANEGESEGERVRERGERERDSLCEGGEMESKETEMAK